jgi:hypothetical protein
MQDYLYDKKQVNSARLYELSYEALVENPIEEVERIYGKFNLSNFQDLEPVLEEYIDALNGHTRDSYTIGQKELNRVMDHVGFAMKHWNYDMPENLTIIDN